MGQAAVQMRRGETLLETKTINYIVGGIVGDLELNKFMTGHCFSLFYLSSKCERYQPAQGTNYQFLNGKLGQCEWGT